MRRVYWRLAVLAGLGLTIGACALSAPAASTKSAYNTMGTLGDRVVIDRDTVVVNGPRTVLELLEGRVARFRFSANALGRQPLVVVDDVVLIEGLSVLGMMRASDVHRVDILWPAEAAFRYGQAAGQGAIVIRTRNGRPQPGAAL